MFLRREKLTFNEIIVYILQSNGTRSLISRLYAIFVIMFFYLLTRFRSKAILDYSGEDELTEIWPFHRER